MVEYNDFGLAEPVSFSSLTEAYYRSKGMGEPLYYDSATQLLYLDLALEYASRVTYEDYGLSQRYTTITPLLFKPPYQTREWDMERVWYINEGSETPRLVYRVPVDLGEPLTHNMNYSYVVPHVKGTMNYMGLTWKSKGPFFSFPSPPAKGVLNQEVTYSIPDSDLTQTIVHKVDGTVDLVWFASGVRDVNGAGGFGTYNNERSRTLKVSDVASATVNFYFTQEKWIPKVNYKLSISTPDGIVDVSTSYKSQSAIKFVVTPEIHLGLPVVDLDDKLATKIHVSMPDGIKALQAYVQYKQIEMLED